MTISANLSSPFSVFVTDREEIFVHNSIPNDQIESWAFNGTRLPISVPIFSTRTGLFVDDNNTLYSSQDSFHQVVKTSLNDPSGTLIIAAGTGSSGSASYMLNSPFGIFVTTSLDLYVADSGNNRIQLFRAGERNGTTVAGNETIGSITLDYPTGIVVDANGHLFIVDFNNHRIIRSGLFGFRCLMGCSGSPGPASDQLNHPVALSFDTGGNMFVVDRNNSRIQKFALMGNSCSKWDEFWHRRKLSLFLSITYTFENWIKRWSIGFNS